MPACPGASRLDRGSSVGRLRRKAREKLSSLRALRCGSNVHAAWLQVRTVRHVPVLPMKRSRIAGSGSARLFAW